MEREILLINRRYDKPYRYPTTLIVSYTLSLNRALRLLPNQITTREKKRKNEKKNGEERTKLTTLKAEEFGYVISK